MGRLVFQGLIVFGVVLCCLGQQAMGSAEPRAKAGNLVAPPRIIKYKQQNHALFDFGGLQMLHVVTKNPTAYPQCDAVRKRGQEIMVVGNNPKGYAFFVLGTPIAFRTKHNRKWSPLVSNTYKGPNR